MATLNTAICHNKVCTSLYLFNLLHLTLKFLYSKSDMSIFPDPLSFLPKSRHFLMFYSWVFFLFPFSSHPLEHPCPKLTFPALTLLPLLHVCFGKAYRADTGCPLAPDSLLCSHTVSVNPFGKYLPVI